MSQPKLFDPSIVNTPQGALDSIGNILESSTEYSVIAKDIDGKILLWNEGARRIYGYQFEEVVGKLHADILYSPEDIAAGKPKQLLDASIRDGKWEGTIERLRKSGQRFMARVVITLRRDPSGQPIGFLLISKDISREAKLTKAEDALRQSEEKHRPLIAHTPEVTWTVDARGTVTFISANVQGMYGFTAEEVLANGAALWMSRVHPEDRDRVLAAYADLFAGRQAFDAEYRLQRKDGEWIWCCGWSVGTYDRDGVLFADGILHEITARKLAEEQFRDVARDRDLRREQAVRISSLGRMAATIAHKFNNVLMGIQPFAELMRKRADDDAKLQQAAGQILNSVARGKIVTQEILRMARSPEPALQSIDVTRWLENLATEIRVQIGAHISVVVEAPPPDTLFARCDPAQMQQVVTNLALNARDAMGGGGTLTISADRSDMVRIVVADTGSGIPPETLPLIFDPLFTTKQSATGLGLAVAQQLVVRNGGSIAVESTPGIGARFEIELPEAMPVISNILEEPLASLV